MNKKIRTILVLLILLISIPATLSFGQYIPNVPFKQKVIPAPDFSLQGFAGENI